jgi:hypothetical protein
MQEVLMPGGKQYHRSREKALAALLVAPTIAEAARMAGIAERTLRSWLARPDFAKEYAARRRELLQGTLGKLHTLNSKAVETLERNMSSGHGPTEVRAAVAALGLSLRGLAHADLLGGPPVSDDSPPMSAADVIQLATKQLRQIEDSELSSAIKARLTATLADLLLRALTAHVADERFAALQAVLLDRQLKEAS